MKITAIMLILSTCIAMSQQTHRETSKNIGINIPQALELLDLVAQKFTNLRVQLATQKSSFQPAEITAGIAAVTASIGAVEKAASLCDEFFNNFFDISAVKAAHDYMEKNADGMYRVDIDETYKALILISGSMNTLVGVKLEIPRITKICRGGVANVTGV